MIVTPCPRCQETFRIPNGSLPEDAQAVCPWCQEQFALSEVIEHLPPVLGVVSADGSPIELASSPPQVEQGFHQSNGEDTGSGVETASEPWADLSIDDREANTEYLGGEQWGIRGTDPLPGSDEIGTGGQEPILMRAPGRQRKKSSGIRTAIGVVLGGLAALPIAGGILMLMGKTPDWGFWPFDGGSQDSGSGVIAAPMGNLGERSYDRPFGQSLMGSEQLEATSEPSDAALQSILDADQPTQRSDTATSETTSEPTPAGKKDSASDLEDETSVNDIRESNTASTPTSAIQTKPTSTLDAITLLNPAFDADRDFNPRSAELDAQLATKTATDQISPTERPPSSTFTASDETDPNTTETIEIESLEPGSPTANLNLAEDTSRTPTEPSVALNLESPESNLVSDPLRIDDPETPDAASFHSNNLAAAVNLLTSPALNSPSGFDATELSTDLSVDVQLAEAVDEIPIEEEITTETESEISTTTLEIPTETPAPGPTSNEAAANLTAANPSDSELKTEPELPTPELAAAESVANESRDAVTPSDSPESATIVQPIMTAINLVNRLSAFEGAKQNRLILTRDTYLKVAEVCNDPATPTKDIGELANTIATSSAISEIENAGLQWIQHGRRQFDGLAVVGNINQNDGKTTLLLSNGSSLNLMQGSQLPSGTKALVLGRIVDDSTVTTVAIEAIQ